MPHINCIHDVKDPNHTIVVDPKTFQPYCSFCKQSPGNFTQIITVSAAGSLGGQITVQVPLPGGFSYQITANGAGIHPIAPTEQETLQDKIDAFDRAMGIVGK
jgi:hypothetical protein